MEARSEANVRDVALLEELIPSELGQAAARIEPMRAGLGTRRFYRVVFAEPSGDPSSLPPSIVARVEDDAVGQAEQDELAAPAWLPEPPLEPLRSYLESNGLPVPRSYGHFPGPGIDLLEDVGDRTLAGITGPARDRLYREACALVPRWQALSESADRIPAFGRFFDRALIATKAWKWLNWTIPLMLDRPATEEEASQTTALFEGIGDYLASAPRRLSHRDYKAENLHVVPDRDRDGAERLVMIDVQGAFMAPPEYDLVCLLYDLQVDLEEAFVKEQIRETLPSLPDAPEVAEAAVRFDALAVLRLCKDVSHVVHAARARGDTRRWREIPRGLALIERAAGRLGHTFPGIRTLTSVIHALTQTVGSSDSENG